MIGAAAPRQKGASLCSMGKEVGASARAKSAVERYDRSFKLSIAQRVGSAGGSNQVYRFPAQKAGRRVQRSATPRMGQHQAEGGNEPRPVPSCMAGDQHPLFSIYEMPHARRRLRGRIPLLSGHRTRTVVIGGVNLLNPPKLVARRLQLIGSKDDRIDHFCNPTVKRWERALPQGTCDPVALENRFRKRSQWPIRSSFLGFAREAHLEGCPPFRFGG